MSRSQTALTLLQLEQSRAVKGHTPCFSYRREDGQYNRLQRRMAAAMMRRDRFVPGVRHD